MTSTHPLPLDHSLLACLVSQYVFCWSSASWLSLLGQRTSWVERYRESSPRSTASRNSTKLISTLRPLPYASCLPSRTSTLTRPLRLHPRPDCRTRHGGQARCSPWARRLLDRQVWYSGPEAASIASLAPSIMPEQLGSSLISKSSMRTRGRLQQTAHVRKPHNAYIQKKCQECSCWTGGLSGFPAHVSRAQSQLHGLRQCLHMLEFKVPMRATCGCPGCQGRTWLPHARGCHMHVGVTLFNIAGTSQRLLAGIQ